MYRDWWGYKADPDPEVTPWPAYKDGYVLFKISDPDSTVDPWYDSEILDGYPHTSVGGPWNNVTVTCRVKMLNQHTYGTYGWGLWYSEWPVYNNHVALFFWQQDDPYWNTTGLDYWRALQSNGLYAENLVYELEADGIEGTLEEGVFKFTSPSEEVISKLDELIDKM